MSNMAKSTDQRDKVFAILGLTYDGPTLLPIPSYVSSVEAISTRLTMKFIKATSSLDCVIIRSVPSTSWSLNWFDGATWSNKRVVSYLLRESKVFTTFERTSTSWHASRDTKPNVRRSGKHLVLRGNIVGGIHSCTTAVTHRETLPAEHDAWHENSYKPGKEPTYQSKEYTADAIRFCFCLALRPTKGCLWSLALEDKHPKKYFWKLFGYFLQRRHRSKKKKVRRVSSWLGCTQNSGLRLAHGVDPSAKLEGLLCHKSPHSWSSYSAVHIRELIEHVWKTLQLGYRLCVLKSGHIGWVTARARPGDLIAIVHGCSVPVVLRKTTKSSAFTIVGESIMYGLMNGDGMTSQFEEIKVK